MQEWVYLSPHLDDAALSCGGLIWEQSRSGYRVDVWTICAGDPPDQPLSAFAESLHARWRVGREAARRRRQEDQASCRILGADYRHFDIPDCIYRPGLESGTYLYDSEEALSGGLKAQESRRVKDLRQILASSLPNEAVLVCPLTLGGHVDHQLVRAAADGLERPVCYYLDYPYVLRPGVKPGELIPAGYCETIYPVSPVGLESWQASVLAHTSQLSTFWPDERSMRAALADYCMANQGVPLWQPVTR